MTLQDFAPFGKDARIEPEKALRLGMGAAATPLWAAYYAAAGAGVAYWAMTAWTRRALTGEAKSFAAAQPRALEAPEAAVEAAAIIEPAAEAVSEPVIEAAAEVAHTVEAAIETPVEAALETAPAVEATAETLDAAAADLVQPAVEQAPAKIAAAVAAVAKPARRKPLPKLDA
ncbi:MAG: hypothetical protein JSR45_16910 [Proteobacteria bacterium]|nr:hypothetical protein [Pseudomonadota bacterium]